MNTSKFIFTLSFMAAFSAATAQNVQPSDCSAATIETLKPLAEKKMKTEEGYQASLKLAACYLAADDTANLNNLTTRFLEYYAGEPKRSRMELIAAEAMLRKEQSVENAIDILLNVLSYSQNNAIKEDAEKLAIRTISKNPNLQIAQLTNIADKALVNRKVANATWLRLGREQARRQNSKAARHWFKRVISANENADWVATAQEEIAKLEGQPSIPTVLILAPLTGDFAEFGNDAVKGARLAFEQSNLKNKVNLRIADTRADAVEALRQTRLAVAQDSVVAIIGPLMSAPAATVAAWLSSVHTRIPMLTPTATDAGISRMGPNIFQVNVSMENLATGIANYAMSCLGIREFAVLSPVGDFGTAMTQSFERAVERRGGAVVAIQEFEEGQPDYTTEFRKLRATRFKQILHKRNIARGAKDLDAIGGKERKAFLQDSVFSIPGVFIPSSSPSDAGLIARQVAFHKIRGTLLGTSGWYGQDLIDEGKKLVEGAHFSVSSATTDSSKNYTNFSNAYKSAFNEEPKPDKVSGLSYNAANIVFSLLANGETDLVKKISSQKTFSGVYGDIRFERGANANVQIMSVDSSAFVDKTQCPDK